MKVREAYLANLKAQQANIDKTANAIKMFQQTGQTPIAPQDSRSMSEKFSDIEKLKRDLRKMLGSLTDNPNINVIMGQLTNEEVQGIVLLFGEIEKTLKAGYREGVPAPIFIEYVRRYLKDYTKNLGLTTGLQDVIASELKLTRNILAQIIPNQAVMMELIRAISSAPTSPQQVVALNAAQALSASLPNPDDILSASSTLSAPDVQDLTDLTDDAMQNVPTSAQVQGLTKDITDALRSGKPKDATDILNGALQFIQLQFDDLQKLKDISDVVQQKQTLSTIPKSQPLEVPQAELANIARIVKASVRRVQTGTRVDRQGRTVPVYSTTEKEIVAKATLTAADMKLAKTISDIDRASAEEIQTMKLTKTAVIAYYDYLSKRDQKRGLSGEDKQTLQASTIDELRQILITDKESGGLSFSAEEELTPEQQTLANTGGIAVTGIIIPDLVDADVTADRLQPANVFANFSVDEKIEYISGLYNKGFFDADQDTKNYLTNLINMYQQGTSFQDAEIQQLYTTLKTITGKGLKRKSSNVKGKKLMFGTGVNQVVGKSKFPNKVDFNEGVSMDKSYIPFGRYVINRHKLGDNKLMIKTISGGAIPKIPTLCISGELGKIIKKMVGGAMPTYNEMNSLSEEDQNTLYKVFKLAQIDKADLLPAPNKSKEEQEMNRFMILKGQIQAGNDNKELVKEFKVMLMKFINGGKIPKAQGMDIVCDLMALGY
jgi:hypothetical protein